MKVDDQKQLAVAYQEEEVELRSQCGADSMFQAFWVS